MTLRCALIIEDMIVSKKCALYDANQGGTTDLIIRP